MPEPVPEISPTLSARLLALVDAYLDLGRAAEAAGHSRRASGYRSVANMLAALACGAEATVVDFLARYPEPAIDGPAPHVVVTFHDWETASGVVGPFRDQQGAMAFASGWLARTNPPRGLWNFRVEVVPLTDPADLTDPEIPPKTP